MWTKEEREKYQRQPFSRIEFTRNDLSILSDLFNWLNSKSFRIPNQLQRNNIIERMNKRFIFHYEKLRLK